MYRPTVDALVRYFGAMGFEGDVLERITGAFTLKQYSKNDYVLEAGTTSAFIAIVKEGLFQYYVTVEGEERTTYISMERTFVASLWSFLKQVPAQENIRALTDGSLYALTRTQLRELVRDIPAFKNFYIGLLENALCGIDATRHDLIVLTAEQRYQKMLAQEPHLLQRIPLQYLASILGVTPRHLSRIRNSVR